jgi:hypothetical protein
MLKNLAHHFKKSRLGVFYFCMVIPAALRPKIGNGNTFQLLLIGRGSGWTKNAATNTMRAIMLD